MKLFTSLFLLFISNLSIAQTNSMPCSSPEATQFDFWIGDWDLTWSDTLHGSNHIEKIMNGCTIQENFSNPNTNFNGKSWSVYNKNYKIWQQTWVDNQGSYIDLTGGMAGDSLILTTTESKVPLSISPSGKIINRMVYENITANSFDWNWESSTDSGKTWKINWHISYKRKSS